MPEKFKNATISIYFGFVSRKTCTGKSNDGQDIIFKKIRFQSFSKNPVVRNSSTLESIFQKLHFSEGLMWMVGQTVEMKPSFQILST